GHGSGGWGCLGPRRQHVPAHQLRGQRCHRQGSEPPTRVVPQAERSRSMKAIIPCWFFWGGGLLLGLAAPPAAGPAAQGPAPKAAPSAATIEQVIRQLGDDSFPIREAATRQLLERAQEAALALRQAQRSPDKEVAWWAAWILEEAPRRDDRRAVDKLQALADVGQVDRFIDLLVSWNGHGRA